jgi:hypothetical protein
LGRSTARFGDTPGLGGHLPVAPSMSYLRHAVAEALGWACSSNGRPGVEPDGRGQSCAVGQLLTIDERSRVNAVRPSCFVVNNELYESVRTAQEARQLLRGCRSGRHHADGGRNCWWRDSERHIRTRRRRDDPPRNRSAPSWNPGKRARSGLKGTYATPTDSNSGGVRPGSADRVVKVPARRVGRADRPGCP